MSRYKTQHFVEYNGQKLSLKEFAQLADMTYASAFRRVVNGKESAEQIMKRKRRKVAQIEYDGESLTLVQAAKKYHVCVSTIKGRLDRGWSVEEALLGKNNPYKPNYKPKGCNWPDCFNCKLDDCYATG